MVPLAGNGAPDWSGSDISPCSRVAVSVEAGMSHASLTMPSGQLCLGYRAFILETCSLLRMLINVTFMVVVTVANALKDFPLWTLPGICAKWSRSKSSCLFPPCNEFPLRPSRI